jgi:hypothetical protein
MDASSREYWERSSYYCNPCFVVPPARPTPPRGRGPTARPTSPGPRSGSPPRSPGSSGTAAAPRSSARPGIRPLEVRSDTRKATHCIYLRCPRSTREPPPRANQPCRQRRGSNRCPHHPPTLGDTRNFWSLLLEGLSLLALMEHLKGEVGGTKTTLTLSPSHGLSWWCRGVSWWCRGLLMPRPPGAGARAPSCYCWWAAGLEGFYRVRVR